MKYAQHYLRTCANWSRTLTGDPVLPQQSGIKQKSVGCEASSRMTMGLVRRLMVSFCCPVRKPVHEPWVMRKSTESSYSLVYLSLLIRRFHAALATGTRDAICDPPGVRTITSSMNRLRSEVEDPPAGEVALRRRPGTHNTLARAFLRWHHFRVPATHWV